MAAWLPSVTSSTSLAALARWLHRLILFQRVRLSTPIEFSLPFLPSPSSVINNLISIAACYERHDFSLHCILAAVLNPISPSCSTRAPQTTQFALGHLRPTPSRPSVAAPTVLLETPFCSPIRHPRRLQQGSFLYSTAIREASSKTACSWRWVSTPVTRIEAYWNCMAGVWS